ncbi:MAG: response regulator [Desulfobacteraceae bacterium]|nr:MAG: response regulator [Desulfobacteraceae bacterium]
MKSAGDGKCTPFSILMAEDDPDDRLFIEQAFQELQVAGELYFVENGEELMDFLRRRGIYSDPDRSPRPALILLDLNMPKKDGRQCLKEIKADSGLQDIPVVVWTTSNLEEDIAQCTEAGADSYMTKPASYPGLIQAVREISDRWFPGSVPGESLSKACPVEIRNAPMQEYGGIRRGWDHGWERR